MMKKLLLCAVTALTFFNAKSQDVQNTIKINPLSALLATGSVFYERKVSEGVSAQLGVAYTGVKLDDVKFSGLAITPEVRFYLKKHAPAGMYVAPFLRYQNFTVSDDDDKGSYTSFGGGVLMGYQWVYSNRSVRLQTGYLNTTSLSRYQTCLVKGFSISSIDKFI